ncbi:MAG: clostripain-related cysteine peptidase [Prevotella sp.]
MKYLLTVICGLLLFSSCKDDHENPEENLLDRTVIVYVTGDNNLSWDVEANMTDLVVGSTNIGEKNRIVLIADNNDIKPTQIVIKNGQVEEQLDFEEEFYTTDPERMRILLNDVMNKYKSKSYGILLWGHSTGWLIERDTLSYAKTKGYGYDDTGTNSLNTTWINYPTMAKVFESLPSKFDFIIGDCCLLQCAEVAYELRNCTNYIIGAPSETPDKGIPYKEVVPLMFDSSSDSYMKVAELIADNTLQDNGIYYNVPTSVIKTSEMENLATATKKVIMQGLLPYPVNTTQAIYYFKYSGIKIMYDMQDIFLKNVNAEAYNEWKMAFDAAVIYRKPSNRWLTSYICSWDDDFTVTDTYYGGMSMFFPMEQYDRMVVYKPNEQIKYMQWYKAAGIDEYVK